MSPSTFDDTAFRRGFAHALREVQRGMELAAERGLSLADLRDALTTYQEAVEDWRRLPAGHYIEQPAFRPGGPPSG